MHSIRPTGSVVTVDDIVLEYDSVAELVAVSDTDVVAEADIELVAVDDLVDDTVLVPVRDAVDDNEFDTEDVALDVWLDTGVIEAVVEREDETVVDSETDAVVVAVELCEEVPLTVRVLVCVVDGVLRPHNRNDPSANEVIALFMTVTVSSQVAASAIRKLPN